MPFSVSVNRMTGDNSGSDFAGDKRHYGCLAWDRLVFTLSGEILSSGSLCLKRELSKPGCCNSGLVAGEELKLANWGALCS